MATIRIVDLKVRAIIGTHAWERKNKQELLVNIIFDYDHHKASKSDDLKDAVNYERIGLQVIKIIESSKYYLLEKLATQVMEAVLADKKVILVTVRIDKPQAMAEAKHIAYEISGKN